MTFEKSENKHESRQKKQRKTAETATERQIRKKSIRTCTSHAQGCADHHHDIKHLKKEMKK